MESTYGYIDFRVFERDYCLSRRMFFKLIAEGKLTAYRPTSRRTLVLRSDVERLFAASKSENVLARLVEDTVAEVVGK